MMHTTLDRLTKMERERGPRWLVYGTIRQGEFIASYTDAADTAEWMHQKLEADGYRQVRTVVPVGGVDLAKLGRDRADAKRVLREVTATLRAGVVQALTEGRSESEVARTAGIDRQTVRAWAGKG